MSNINVNAVRDFILWWTSSSGDELTRSMAPQNLALFFEYFQRQAERVAFSKVELLMLFTEILMSELVSNLESFDSISEWLEALGEYWAAETGRWQREMNLKLAVVNPMTTVSIMVYTEGRPREVTPRLAADFRRMVDEDRIEIFRNTTIQQANRL